MSDFPHDKNNYDFVAEHGDTHAVLASGERAAIQSHLPKGEGIYLVAGKVTFGGFEATGVLPAIKKPRNYEPALIYPPTDLSLDCQWIAVPTDATTLVLSDLQTGKSGKRFWPVESDGFPLCRAIHPNGECIAYRTAHAVKLVRPEGNLWHEAEFSQSDERYPAAPTAKVAHGGETLTFSACGQYLWFTHVGSNGDSLILLEFPTLKVLDRCDVPHNPASYYDNTRTWGETEASLNLKTDTLYLVRQAGDTLLGVTVHSRDRHRIVTSPHQLDIHDSKVNTDRINEIAFSADGKQIAALNSYGMLFSGNAETFELNAQTSFVRFGLGIYRDYEDIEQIGYWNNLLFALGEDRHLHILESRTLAWKNTFTFVAGTCNLLPNGVFLRTFDEETVVLQFQLTPEPVSVVFELDAKLGTVHRVLQKQGTDWTLVTEPVATVEPNFRFED